jgi:hypothetical protein
MSNNTAISRRRKTRDRVAKQNKLVTLAPMAPDEDFVTEAETAIQLKVHENTLRNWLWRGIGPPFFKFGHRVVRYTRRQNAEWASGLLRTSTTKEIA